MGLTGLADAQRVLGGVEHLILVLFVDDLALAQVRREFGRVEDARELVPHALHAIPQLLAALLRPGGRRAQLLRLLRPHRDPLKREKGWSVSVWSPGSGDSQGHTLQWDGLGVCVSVSECRNDNTSMTHPAHLKTHSGTGDSLGPAERSRGGKVSQAPTEELTNTQRGRTRVANRLFLITGRKTTRLTLAAAVDPLKNVKSCICNSLKPLGARLLANNERADDGTLWRPRQVETGPGALDSLSLLINRLCLHAVTS